MRFRLPRAAVSIGEVHRISLAEKCLVRQNATQAEDTKSLWEVRLADGATEGCMRIELLIGCGLVSESRWQLELPWYTGMAQRASVPEGGTRGTLRMLCQHTHAPAGLGVDGGSLAALVSASPSRDGEHLLDLYPFRRFPFPISPFPQRQTVAGALFESSTPV